MAIPIRVKSIDAQNQAHGVIEDASGEMRNGTPMVFAVTAVVPQEPKAA